MGNQAGFRAGLSRRWWIAGLIVIGLVIAILGTVAWVGSERALNPDFRETPWGVEDFPELGFEEISFESDTGVTLEGRFFPGEHEATVIALHGFSERQDQVLPKAEMLTEAGFNVLSYNGRHPVYGDGIYSTLGVLEREDLVSAVDYLVHQRDDVDPDRIGAYGISLGGATVLLGAELDPRIRAVVAEAAFSDAQSVVDSSFERYIGLPSFPFSQVTRAVAEWRAGAKLVDAQPIDAIAAVDDRPILLIHGLADESVPPDHSERNLAAAGDNVEIWWVPDAGHTDAHIIAGDEYRDRLTEFFSVHLLR